MCRLLGFIGSTDSPELLADIVLWPARSIIKQSYDARERKGDPSLGFHLSQGSLNGDGFGIGWFSPEERRNSDPTPCVFTSITPAWNNENLARLSCKIVSPLIFAHVRAAYPGMPVSEQNCHPFMFGRYLWMHNGVVAGFAQIKRALLALLSDVAYNAIQSFHSDSAVSFALFLHHLPNPYSQQPPEVMLKAMQETILTLSRLQADAGVTGVSLLNFVVSDGSCLLATRFVSPATADAASLYYAEGAAFVRSPTEQQGAGGAEKANGGACCAAASGGQAASSSVLLEANYELVYGERGARVAFVASEPITSSSADWVSVPKNMCLVITREKGGFINILRSPITTVVPAVTDGNGGTAGVLTDSNGQVVAQHNGYPSAVRFASIAGLPTAMPPGGTQEPTLSRMLAQSVVAGSAGGATGATVTTTAWTAAGGQPEVALCLEAISRGLAAKSRPWLLLPYSSSHRATGADPLSADPLGPMPSRHHSLGGTDPTTARSVPGGPEGLALEGMGLEADIPANPGLKSLVDDDEDVPHFQRLVGHAGPLLCMVLDKPGQRLYTASVDCTIKTWSLVDNRCLGSVTAGTKPITAMQLRGRWLYSTGGRKLRVWDTDRRPDGALVCVDTLRIGNHCGNVRCVLAQPGRVFLGCQDASVKCFRLDEAPWPAASLLVSKDTDLMRRNSMEDLPPRDADYVTPASQGHVGAINALVASANGDYIISAAGDAMIRVWRSSDLSHVRTLRGHRGSVLALLVIENLLVSGARDNTIRVWDLDLDMMCRCTLTGHKDDVTHLSAFTLKSRYGLSGSGAGNTPAGLSPTARDASGSAPAAAQPVTTILPCTVVASASADGTVRLWSLTWTCLCVLALPNEPRAGLNPAVPYTSLDDDVAHAVPAASDSNRHNATRNGTHTALVRKGPSCGPHAAAGTTGNGHNGNHGVSRAAGADVAGDEDERAGAPPAVLCSAVTASAVCAGYGDGEVRVWPCPGLHLAAMQQVAVDMGLPPLEGTASLLAGNMSPLLLSPYPLMLAQSGQSTGGALVSGQPGGDGLDAAGGKQARPISVGGARLPGGPQTLAQANISQLLSVLSHPGGSTALATALAAPVPGASQIAAGGSPPGAAVVLSSSLAAAVAADAAHTAGGTGTAAGGGLAAAAAAEDAVVGSLASCSSLEAGSLVSSRVQGAGSPDHPPGTAVPARSSGSHYLDKQMMHSLEEIMLQAQAGSEGTTPRSSLRGSSLVSQHSDSLAALIEHAKRRMSIGSNGGDVQRSPSHAAGELRNSAGGASVSVNVSADATGGGGGGGVPATSQRSSAFAAPPTATTGWSAPPAAGVAMPAAPAVAPSPTGTSLLTRQLERAGVRANPPTPTADDAPASTSAAASSHPLPIGGNGAGARGGARTAHVEFTGMSRDPSTDLAGPPGLGPKGAFGSFMGVDHMEHLAARNRANVASSHASSTVLESCEELAEVVEQLASQEQTGAMTMPPHDDAVSAGAVGDASVLPRPPSLPRIHTSLPPSQAPQGAEGAGEAAQHTPSFARQPSIRSTCSSAHEQVTALCLSAVRAQLAGAQQLPGSRGATDADDHSSPADLGEPALLTTARPGSGEHGAWEAPAPLALTVPQGSTQDMYKQLKRLHAALEAQLNRPAPGLRPGNTFSTDALLESCLREFVRIQTVSNNPRLRDECVRGAKYLAKLLESLGADVKVVRPYEDKNPVVIGRLGHDPSKPTVCFYGHYDVQPAQEPDWATPPFELNAVNEYLYGRGTSDNKGPVLAFIFAVKELMDQAEAETAEGGAKGGSLPLNIVFVYEGEEENGSIGFREAVTQNLRWFEGVELIIISNTNWVGESVPCLTYGMRGMMSMSVSVSGPQRDVHSGNDGGVFREPMMDLIAVLSTLMTEGSTDIRIPGFQDQVAPGLIDLAWSSLQQHGQGEFQEDAYKVSLGVPALTPPPGARNLLEARWCRPSLSVVDIRPSGGPAPPGVSERSVCYRFGPTRFSVIPRTAVGKISIRFVARQDPKHILSALRAHIQAAFAALKSPNRVHVHVDALGNWWEADVNSKWIQMAEAAIRREWGCEPLYTREGGTMPVASVLERLLNAPAIMIPMGQSSDSPHLANERIRRLNLVKGKSVIRALLEEVAGYRAPGTPSADLCAARAASGGLTMGTCPAFVETPRNQSEAGAVEGAAGGAARQPPPLPECGAVREQA